MRIRTIKPEFWTNEKLCSLPEVVHMFAAAILNYADDEGYFNANPGLIKGALFPIREPSVNIHVMLSELSNIDYLRLANGEDGRSYGWIVNFKGHQKINRPSESKIKHLADFTESSVSIHGNIIEYSLAEQGTGNREGEQERGAGINAHARDTKTNTDDLQKLIIDIAKKHRQNMMVPDLSLRLRKSYITPEINESAIIDQIRKDFEIRTDIRIDNWNCVSTFLNAKFRDYSKSWKFQRKTEETPKSPYRDLTNE